MATIKGGRPGDPVWMFFQKLDGTQSKCIECQEQCSSKIECLRAHIKRCPKLKATPVSTSGLKRPTPELDTDRDDTACLPPPAKRQFQMSAFTVNITVLPRPSCITGWVTMAKLLSCYITTGRCCQLTQHYRLTGLTKLLYWKVTTHILSGQNIFRLHLKKKPFPAPANSVATFSHLIISTASQMDQLSSSSLTMTDRTLVSDLTPVEFLDKVDEETLMTCSPNLVAECLRQLGKHYFEHVQTIMPWLLSHHHDIYKQLHESGKLLEVSKDIRQHPKFNVMCQRLEQAYQECSDQELACSLLLFLYMGVHPQDSLVHSLLLEVRGRIPSMNLHSLTTVSWLCNTLPERDFVTRRACLQKLAATCMEVESLSPDDVQYLCTQEINHKHLLSTDATLRLCKLILGQTKSVTYFCDPQHLAVVASFFGRQEIMYLLKKYDLVRQFDSWSEHFKYACLDMVDEMTDYDISSVCQFLKFVHLYNPTVRRQFEKQSLKLLSQDPGVGKVANLISSLSPFSSKEIVQPFEKRLFHELSDVDDRVICMLVHNLFGAKREAFSAEMLMKVERALTERCSRLLQDYDQIREIIIVMGNRRFVDTERGMRFFEILLENVIESPSTNPNCDAMASCYLMAKAEFPESSNEPFQQIESSILHSSDACAIDMFQFLNSVPRDCQNSLRTVERYVQRRLLQAVTNSRDLFHLCYIVRNMIRIDESFKYRDRQLTEAIMKRLEEFIRDPPSSVISESLFLSVIDILRLMKYYTPSTLDMLVNHYCDSRELHLEKITVRLLCTLSIFSHRSETVENFMPSVIKLIGTKLEQGRHKDVLLMLNYLMRLQVYLEEEIRQLFSFEFMTKLGSDSGYVEEPARIVLVELTRRCLLEHPELDIPWFHDEYCRTHIVTGEPKSCQTFRDGVSATLRYVLGGENHFLRWSYTPYFYSIDFECILDESNKPVNVKKLPPGGVKDTWQRVAIMLHTQGSFWLHSDQLRGSIRDKNNHLELMGYKVIPINYKEWFSELVTNEQRVNYLRCHILR
ncbi:hypothetical protein LSH36_369g03035 [Paralvinella palmiformis]|uniref:RAP domain-containing protein n=1 Tax=Paralvinella palmiformis TaxID=53620 RepID=A0AAD9JEQ5_9ANNE|nr:hypothetical protein LSH36_369g03035 [Paralvinella palmiformis]